MGLRSKVRKDIERLTAARTDGRLRSIADVKHTMLMLANSLAAWNSWSRTLDPAGAYLRNKAIRKLEKAIDALTAVEEHQANKKK